MYVDDEGWLHWNFERPDPPRMFLHTNDPLTGDLVTYEYMDDGTLKEVKRIPSYQVKA